MPSPRKSAVIDAATAKTSWQPPFLTHAGNVRWPIFFLALLTTVSAAEPIRRAPPVQVQEISSPAKPGAKGPSLALAPNGAVWLTWLETENDTTALRFTTFDPNARAWRSAGTIANGENWFVNWADFPALTVGENGQAVAAWFVSNPAPSAATSHGHHGPGYHARISQTADGGKTWSRSVPLTRESDSVEFVSLTTLADGRVLAAWLDGRGKKSGGSAQQLFARALGSGLPDTLVDDSVCDCCPTSLTAFLDGSALLAYRGRSADEIRDIRIARFRGRVWDKPHMLNPDGWKIAGCPVNGPQLASDGGRVAAAWFTAADEDPRVLASFSPDAGARFLAPLRLDQEKPSGRVETLLLRDGAMLVIWLGADGAVWLRRITPDFLAGDATLLASAEPNRMKAFPRAALLRDYAGGKTRAQVLVTFAEGGANGGVRTLLVTIPEGELLEAEQNCDCAPSPDQLRGYSIRGTLVAANGANRTVRVQHPELPGIFPAGTREFHIAENLLEALPPGRQFLGRIERRDDAWWLFDVRLIAAAK